MKSFVALLVVALALTASAQSGCAGVASTVFNSSYASSVISVFTAACQQCASGYLLSGAQGSTCTALTGGCWWGYNSSYCLVCQPYYVLNTTSNLCVACGTGVATCTITSGALAVATCQTGYYLLSSACVSCSTSGAGTAASPTGITNCTACSATATQSTISSVVTYYVTCTACTGYTYVAVSGAYNTVAVCGVTSGTSLTYTQVGNGSITAGSTTYTVVSGAASCASIVATATASTPTFTLGCLAPVALYYCPSGTGNAESVFICTAGSSVTAGTTVTSATAFGVAAATTTGVVVPAGTSAGLYVISTGVVTATSCATGYALVSGACVTAITGCYTQTSATACSVAAAGYHLASVGASTTTACSNGNPCSSGSCGSSTLALNVSGNCITVTTAISNCLVQNGTSSCAVCAGGYGTTVGTCGQCPSQCSVCSSTTTCTSCNTGYVVSNGACSVKSTGTSSAKALFAGLAFISMIFYYIF